MRALTHRIRPSQDILRAEEVIVMRTGARGGFGRPRQSPCARSGVHGIVTRPEVETETVRVEPDVVFVTV
jgi:hypothetical protein